MSPVRERHTFACPGVIGVRAARRPRARSARSVINRTARSCRQRQTARLSKRISASAASMASAAIASPLFDDDVGGRRQIRGFRPCRSRRELAVAARPSGSDRCRPARAGSSRSCKPRRSARICGNVRLVHWPIVCVTVISDTIPSASNGHRHLARSAAGALMG